MERGEGFYDYENYLHTVNGDTSHYYYGYWFLPIFALLSRLPPVLTFGLWGLANIAGVFFACRVFGGSAAIALTLFQMFYALGFGQITGIIVGALALMYWAVVKKHWYLAGLALSIALTKYQMGLVPGLALLWLTRIEWSARFKIALTALAVIGASFLLYGFWVERVLASLVAFPPEARGSVSLWRWIGFGALLFFIPPFVVSLTRLERYILLIAAGALAFPYFQQSDLLLLLAMPLGLFALLGNSGYIFFIGGFDILKFLFVVPLTIYIVTLVGPLQRWRHKTEGHDQNQVVKSVQDG